MLLAITVTALGLAYIVRAILLSRLRASATGIGSEDRMTDRITDQDGHGRFFGYVSLVLIFCILVLWFSAGRHAVPSEPVPFGFTPYLFMAIPVVPAFVITMYSVLYSYTKRTIVLTGCCAAFFVMFAGLSYV